MLRKINFVFTLLVLGTLSGCSKAPDLIRRPPPEDPTLRAVREDINRYKGESVRWGGAIAGTDNLEDHTMIEIIARELGKRGQPKDTDVSPGRFFARIDEFLEPAIYRQGRELTVYGIVEEVVEDRIGEHPYLFPIVRVDTYHLWEPRTRVRSPVFYPPRLRSGFGFGHRRHPFGFGHRRHPFW
jgi:outer membrane lipoprotein